MFEAKIYGSRRVQGRSKRFDNLGSAREWVESIADALGGVYGAQIDRDGEPFARHLPPVGGAPWFRMNLVA